MISSWKWCLNMLTGNEIAQYDGNIIFVNEDWALQKYDNKIGTVLSLATALTNRMVGLQLYNYVKTAQVLVTGVI